MLIALGNVVNWYAHLLVNLLTVLTIDVTAFPKSDNKDEYSAAEAFKIYREKNLDNSKFTVSSDGGGCIPHFDKQGELLHLDYGRCELLSATLKELLDDGIPENEVLPAFTSNVATLLKLHQKGTIAVGNDADLVIWMKIIRLIP